MAWLQERTHDDPTTELDWEDWERSNSRLHRFSQATRAKWQQKFAVRASALFDELVKNGAVPVEWGRETFQDAVNPVVMQGVARQLGEMAASLTRR